MHLVLFEREFFMCIIYTKNASVFIETIISNWPNDNYKSDFNILLRRQSQVSEVRNATTNSQL